MIDTFNFGLEHTLEYDLIGKFDADIILPNNYFELIVNQFQANWKLGMCSGLLYIKKADDWVYENIADKSHVRGPIKLYHKACFNKIGGLRPGVGWDTVDTLLAKYHDFDTLTLPELKVKHLRPTGHGYSSKNYQTKGVAMYKMRYRIVLTKIAALKMAWQAKSPGLYFQAVFGYLKAFFQRQPRYVSKKRESLSGAIAGEGFGPNFHNKLPVNLHPSIENGHSSIHKALLCTKLVFCWSKRICINHFYL